MIARGAIRWLRANAEQYGYSVDRIAVTGTSAGGHLSALLGTSADVKELEGDVGGIWISLRVSMLWLILWANGFHPSI